MRGGTSCGGSLPRHSGLSFFPNSTFPTRGPHHMARVIERENPTLRDVLNKGYSRPTLNAIQLGRLVDVVSDIGLGEDHHRQQDLLGRVYEYFLGQFVSAEGK